MLTDRINSRLAWSYLSNCELHHRITYEYMVQSPPQEDLDPSSFSTDLASENTIKETQVRLICLKISLILRVLAFLITTIFRFPLPGLLPVPSYFSNLSYLHIFMA